MSNDNRPANIHEYTGRFDGKTYYSVCVWVESANQYQVPLDAEEQRLTGCHTEYASNFKSLGKMKRNKAYYEARKRFGYAKKSE